MPESTPTPSSQAAPAATPAVATTTYVGNVPLSMLEEVEGRNRFLCRFGDRCRFGSRCRFLHWKPHIRPLDSSSPCTNCGVRSPNDDRAAKCRDGHVNCQSCVSQIIMHSMRVKSGEAPFLPCAQMGCTVGIDAMSALSAANVEAVTKLHGAMLEHERSKSLETMTNALRELREVVSAAVPPEFHDVIRADVPTEVHLKEEQLRLAVGSMAWECPECSYGPVLHANCDDLQMHDGDRVGDGAVCIANDCPRCGYFSPMIDSWNRWSGTMDRTAITDEELAEFAAQRKHRRSERQLEKMRRSNENIDSMLALLVETMQCEMDEAVGALAAAMRGGEHQCEDHGDAWSTACSGCRDIYTSALDELTRAD